MNGAAKGVGGGWVDRKCESTGGGEREVLQSRTGCREGNLLVFSHQWDHGGDIERMEGDASWAGREMKLRSVLTKERERLANRDKEASDAMRVRRTYTGRDRGLQDVRGSCLQLYLSSRIHSLHQDVWFHHPCLEVAFSWNKYLTWICYL